MKYKSDRTEEYVEVLNEPLHKEIYRTNRFRVYRAVIKPGASTLYHRHSQNTLYITFSGGRIKNIPFRKGQKNRIIFGKSLKKSGLIKLAFERIFTGFVPFPDGLIFFMPNRDSAVIHKAKASSSNKKDMILTGIEILSGHSPDKPFLSGNSCFTEEITQPGLHVLSLSLQPGESYTAGRTLTDVLIMGIRGETEFLTADSDNNTAGMFNKEEMIITDVTRGDKFRNPSRERSKILLIETAL